MSAATVTVADRWSIWRQRRSAYQQARNAEMDSPINSDCGDRLNELACNCMDELVLAEAPNYAALELKFDLLQERYGGGGSIMVPDQDWHAIRRDVIRFALMREPTVYDLGEKAPGSREFAAALAQFDAAKAVHDAAGPDDFTSDVDGLTTGDKVEAALDQVSATRAGSPAEIARKLEIIATWIGADCSCPIEIKHLEPVLADLRALAEAA